MKRDTGDFPVLNALYGSGSQDFAKSIKIAPVSTMSALPATALYLTEAGNTTAISVTDINQGQIGDCFLLSSIGEIAMLKPGFISSMIQVNSNGTETVRLYEAANGKLPTWNTSAYKVVTENVTNTFAAGAVNNAPGQDTLKGQKEIWPQVIEKAVATLDGGYAAISNGGSPVIAMEELTGHEASWQSPASLSLVMLMQYQASGSLVVFDTPGKGSLANSLVSNHAYMFDGVSGSGSAATVKLLNPWGMDQPTPILLSQLSRNFSEVDVGHFS